MAQKMKNLNFFTGRDLEMNNPDADGKVGYIRESSQPVKPKPKKKRAAAKKKAPAEEAPAEEAPAEEESGSEDE